MTQKLKDFLDEAMEKQDAKLMEILSMKDKNEGINKLLELAAHMDMELSSKDFVPELSDEQLASVAGGAWSGIDMDEFEKFMEEYAKENALNLPRVDYPYNPQ